MRKGVWLMAGAVLAALCLGGCSTTSALEEGDVLYTGIHKTRYLKPGETAEAGTTTVASDSAGVIVAIADAATQIENALSGKGKQEEAEPKREKRKLSKEQKAAFAQDRKVIKQALTTAREQVDAVLAYAPNNSLFGSSSYRFPIPTGLYVYNYYTPPETGFARWMLRSFGSTPVLISTVNPETRVKVAENTLHNYGFFRAEVAYGLVQKHNPKKAKIDYTIQTGPVFRLDSICYTGFPQFADSLITLTRRRSYLKQGDPFSVLNLTDEQDRLETIFRNTGYYYYTASLATYRADTVMRPLSVQLEMHLRDDLPETILRRYYIGKTHIALQRSDADSLLTTHQVAGMEYSYSGDREPLRPIVWLQNIAHRPRQIYRQVYQESTEDMLAELGVFSSVSLAYKPTLSASSVPTDTLDLYITATLDRPYTLSFEVDLTEKNSERLGPALSLSLQRKNAFRGAELLKFEIYGSYEWTLHNQEGGDHRLNSYELGATVSLDVPHIVAPLLNSRSFHFPTATTFSLGIDWLNRASYFQMLTFTADITYSWHRTRTSRHTLSPISLTYDRLLNTTSEFQTLLNQTPSLSLSMRDRLVPAIQYTYTYTSNTRRRHTYTWQLTAKEAGNITSSLFALGGRSYSEQGKQILGNQFAQYLKLTSELTANLKLHGDTRLATRFFAGAIVSYGNTTVAPYNDQFYAGGANSIRGFTLRTLGPGHYSTPRTRYSYMDQTGELKLEANVELRTPLFGGLCGAVFIDAGNIWLLRHDADREGGTITLRDFGTDIALSTGCGLRYDLSFLVLRLDLGVALHDPAETSSGYFRMGKFSDRLALHFAIGYPF